MTAAIYAAKYKLNTVIIAKKVGGTALYATKVDNYPGIEPISGIELMQKFKEHTERMGIEIIEDEAVKITHAKNFIITTRENKKYESKKIILALGTERKKLNIEGEDVFMGKGVSYCATCDASLFTGKTVGVVGGGNGAVQTAILCSQYSKEVILICRKDSFKAEPKLVEEAEKNKKIKIMLKTEVKKIKGKKFMEEIELSNGKTINMQGIFIEIGGTPIIKLAKDIKVKLNKENYIQVDAAQKTNIKGVYACGDITTNSNKFKQITTAVGEGAVTALSVYTDIINKR
jgi:thioredoxin reductase (NADPH)